MATGPSTLQKIEDQVTCGVCLESCKKPKVLSNCLHVFCEHCLQAVAHGHNISCPTCRKVTPLPVGGVAELKDFFHHANLLEILESSDRCPKHPEKEAELYCETCEQLICNHCLVPTHRDHQYDLVSKLFAKYDQLIVESLKPVEEQIAALEEAMESVNRESSAIEEQSTTVVAEIHTVFARLRQSLERRETELVGHAVQMKMEKQETLATQREGFRQQLGQRRDCRELVKESRRTCSQGKILGMKSQLVKQMNDLTGNFKPKTLALPDKAHLKFSHNLPECVKTHQQFGDVCNCPLSPGKCQASGEGLKVAMRGQTASTSVVALDEEGEAYSGPVDSLRCELVASDGSSRVRATVKRRDQNIYDISYRPKTTGGHQLHILIEEQPILNSPFTVNVLPNFTAPADIIADLNKPWGIAITEEGEMVVTKQNGRCILIDRDEVICISFRTDSDPTSSAVCYHNTIMLTNSFDECIRQLSSNGSYIRTFPIRRNTDILSVLVPSFKPVCIAVHPLTSMVYVSDSKGMYITEPPFSVKCEFRVQKQNFCPFGISFDRDGNLFVADRNNDRIHVLGSKGEHIRDFGSRRLSNPIGVAVVNSVVYVTEERRGTISIFSTDGAFITSFERASTHKSFYCSCTTQLAVDREGKVYVCDVMNNRVLIFM